MYKYKVVKKALGVDNGKVYYKYRVYRKKNWYSFWKEIKHPCFVEMRRFDTVMQFVIDKKIEDELLSKAKVGIIYQDK